MEVSVQLQAVCDDKSLSKYVFILVHSFILPSLKGFH